MAYVFLDWDFMINQVIFFMTVYSESPFWKKEPGEPAPCDDFGSELEKTIRPDPEEMKAGLPKSG